MKVNINRRKYMDNIKRSIGHRVACLRKDAGLTQAELSAMIDINEKNLSSIECGKNGIAMNTLIALCKALNASADYILFGEAAKSINTPLQELLAKLNPKQQMYAEKFVELYIKSCREDEKE